MNQCARHVGGCIYRKNPYPGGSELASTSSSASFRISSLAPYNGDLGRAMRPVRPDSRIPNGDISFMKASIRVGLADLSTMSAEINNNQYQQVHLHLNDAIIRTYIQNLASKLMCQMRDRFQMLVLMS